MGRCPLPTLAAVNGAAVGAGMNLALVCDVRVAARRARFDTRFLQIGIHPGGGHTWMLQRIIGPQAAAATVLFGEVLDGEQAERAGLVWRTVDDDELARIAHGLAARAAEAPRELSIVTKETLRDMATIGDARGRRRPGAHAPGLVDAAAMVRRTACCAQGAYRRQVGLERIDEGLTMGVVRDLADRYTDEYLALDPDVATMIGMPGHDGELTDYSPEGWAGARALGRRTLAELDEAVAHVGDDEQDRRCARLLRERLEAERGVVEAREPGRLLNNMSSPAQDLKEVFELMPTATLEQWELLATRMAVVPDAYEQYRRGLDDGVARGEMAASRQVTTVLEQLAVWSGEGDGPAVLRRPRRATARGRTRPPPAPAGGAGDHGDRGVGVLPPLSPRRVRPKAGGAPDAVGADRYKVWARYFNGTDLDLSDAYAYGWDEFKRLHAEMEAEAERVLPGSTPKEAMVHLDEVRSVHRVGGGAPRVAERLGARGHGRAGRPALRPGARAAARGGSDRSAGGAAAPYYSSPSHDFSRPGITWYPTQGKTRFTTWEHVSTWYHEGVPGHHLQLAEWVLLSEELSRYQATLGMVSANVEGWALYAERLMDELGFFQDPARRLGFLVAQQLRAVRVVIDIGMHLELDIPTDQPFHPGERWTAGARP